MQPNISSSEECSVGKKKKITNSIFLLPSFQLEVFNIIKELKNRKARRTLDIETKFIKHANPTISFFLSELFYFVHIQIMKVAEVSEVESSRTSLASRTHFEVLGLGLEVQVLGLGLEASGPRKLACPRLEDSTIF